MADLLLAQTSAALTVDPGKTLLTHFQNNWGATVSPAKTLITWSRNYTFYSKNKYAVIIDHLRTKGPAQIIGAGRYRFTGEYICEVISTGPNLDDAKDKLFTVKQEIIRIIDTAVNGLNASGFDEIAIDDFTDSSSTQDNISSLMGAEMTNIAREKAIITVIYDAVVT